MRRDSTSSTPSTTRRFETVVALAALLALLVVAPAHAKSPQTIRDFAPASPVKYSNGSTFALTATGGASGNPVTFASTTKTLCTVAANVVSVIRTGTCKLNANQAGNSKYSAAPMVKANVVVNKGNQSIAFTVPGDAILGAAPFAVAATASSALTVKFTSLTQAACTLSGATVTLRAVGTCTIAADQAGNSNFNAASRVTQSFEVKRPMAPVAVLSIAVGFGHACALTNGGGIKCWGMNTSGQLGDGTTVDQFTPVDVIGLDSGAIAVEAGHSHSCAITVSGGAKCWGDNSAGQLGDGTTTSRNTPVDVTTLADGTLGLTAGITHTCALTGGGKVRCWGDNQWGQLGDSTTLSRYAPVEVIGLDARGTDVRVGDTHSCATLVAGRLQCWGNNTDGQLGDGTTLGHFDPIDVTGLGSGAIAVEPATRHTCALTSSGGIRCWGANAMGQLGDGTTTQHASPVTALGLGAGVAAVAAAGESSCALTGTGGVKCWGANDQSSIPLDIAGATSGVIELGVGSGFGCVITDRGAVRCWGDNVHGQLGDGTAIGRNSLADVTGLAGNSLANQFITFAAIDDHTLGSAAFTVPATASSTLPVTLRSITPDVCGLSGATVTLLREGACAITANQAGNASFNAALQVARSFEVTPARIAQAIVGFSPPTPIAYATGTTFALGATAGASGNPIIFGSNTPDVCTVSGSNAYVLGAGTCTLTADQAGDTAYGPAPQATAIVTISKADQVIVLDAPADLPADSAPLILRATATSGLAVTLASDTGTTCETSGTTVSPLAPGTCTILASQAGDANFNAAPQAAVSFAILPAAQPGTLPQLITPELLHAVLGQPYEAQIIVSGSSPITRVTVEGLPAGITAQHNDHGTVTLQGSPMVAGEYPVTISVTNASGTADLNISISVDPFVDRIDALTAGNSHSCAVFDGGVRCWGANARGQLGNGRTVASTAAVVAVPAGSGATAVSAGVDYSCAVVNGGVQCWGRNDAGQLGVDSTTPSLVPVMAIAPGSGATAIAAGSGHTCAVVDGGVRCWGANAYGQLGNGSTAASLRPVVAIADDGNATAIAVGGSHSCAVVAGGVYCWGAGSANQLGTGQYANRPTPVNVIAEGSGTTAIAAAATAASMAAHTCAVVASGVRCWGDNTFGKLAGQSIGTEQRNAIQPGSGATAVATGAKHTCAVVNRGVTCWGWNSDGQLGDGTNLSSPYQGAMTQAHPASSNATAVAAGERHTCVVINGGVECWGANDMGQIGNQGNPVFPAPMVAFTTGSQVTSIVAHSSRTCAIVGSGLQCWGREFYTSGFTAQPNEQFPPDRIVAQAALGVTHFCAIVDNQVQCGGSNTRGQFGNGATQFTLTPAQLPPGSAITSIATGNNYSCAVVAGTVECWGANDLGQLGNGSTVDSAVPVLTTPQIDHATAVSAHSNHSCAIVEGGVRCWGYNGSGQLGNGSTVNSLVPVTAIATGSSASAVAAGDRHTCAVIAGGIQCWGDNGYSQLGNGSTESSAVPVTTVAAGSQATAVAAGDRHTCAIVKGGVQCWGDNTAGQLGNGNLERSPVPVSAIPGGSNVTAIAVGAAHSCAVVNGGAVCWGSNASGELANPVTGGPQKVFAAVTSLFPPAAPTITEVVANTSSITLTFSPPSSDGGAPVTGYTATCSANGQSALSQIVGANARTVTVTGAAAGVAYLCAIAARNIAGTGEPSGDVVAIPGSTGQESVSILTPTSNSQLTSPQSITVTVVAQSGEGTIARVELLDGYSVLKTEVPTGGVASYTLTYVWSPVPAGNHTLTAKVTNSQTVVKTSAPVYVLVLDAPTVTLTGPANELQAPATVDLLAIASPAGIARVAFVEIFDGENRLTTLNMPPYRFAWSGVGPGSYHLTARATDTFGLTTTSAPLDVVVHDALGVTFAADLDGSTLDDDTLAVTGTLQAPPNSAVTVNGQIASITADGSFFANAVPVQPGANAVTAAVTTIDGETRQQTINVLRSDVPSLFEVTVSPAEGIAAPDDPFMAGVTIASPNGTPFGTISLSCSDGTTGIDVTTLGTYQCGYLTPGQYTITVIVRDAAGMPLFSAKRRVNVWLPVDRFRSLTGVYLAVTDRLKSGNIDGAVKFFTSTLRDEYRTAFVEAGAGLASLVDGFGEIAGARVNDDFAELVLLRQTSDGELAFSVFLIQDTDGIWRIDGF